VILLLSFFGHIQNQRKIKDILIPNFTYFKEKNFKSLEGILEFLKSKTPNSPATAQNIKKTYFVNRP